jgi:hypothetical protein
MACHKEAATNSSVAAFFVSSQQPARHEKGSGIYVAGSMVP